MRTKDDPVVVVFAARVQAEREARRWSITELAARARIGYPTLWRIEHGASGPTLAYAVRIAAALEMTVDELVRS